MNNRYLFMVPLFAALLLIPVGFTVQQGLDLYRIDVLSVQNGWTASLRQQAGNLRYEIGDSEGAAAHWRAALLLNPNNAALMRRLAELYIERQQWADAITILKQLVTLQPSEIWAHYQLGLILAPTRPAEARSHLETYYGSMVDPAAADNLLTVLRNTPTDLMQPLHVGIALANGKFWSYAERAFRQSPGHAEAIAFTGLMRDMQGKNSENWIRQAVALDPQNPRVRYVEALHYRFMGDDLASWSAFAQAIQLDPLNPVYQAELGSTYYRLGDLQSAEYWLRQAVALSDDNPLFVEQLDLFYASSALTLPVFGIDAQSRMVDAPADVKAEYGWSLHLAAKSDQALDEINAALDEEPDNLRALYYKARILIDTGDPQAAKPLLQHIIDAGAVFSNEAQRIFENLDE